MESVGTSNALRGWVADMLVLAHLTVVFIDDLQWHMQALMTLHTMAT